MEIQKTARGFCIVNFKDRNKIECSLQKSSLATEDCIWLGCNKIEMQEFIAHQGWKKRPEFDDEQSIEHHYVANTKMHLTREQVAELIPHLQLFVETGEL